MPEAKLLPFLRRLQEVERRVVTDEQVQAAARAISKRRFGSEYAWAEDVLNARVALEAALALPHCEPDYGMGQAFDPST